MPDVTPSGSSPPPASGSVEDPQPLLRPEALSSGTTFPKDASDLGLPERQSLSDPVGGVVVEANGGPEETDQPRNREEVIKEISISSASFIGPACRPQPAFEDELSEFYKELERVDQPGTEDGGNNGVSQSWPPPDGLHGKSRHGAQSWPPPVGLHRKSHHGAQSWPPPDALHGKGQHIGQSWPPPDALHRKSHHGAQSWPPPDGLHRKSHHGAQSWPPPDALHGKGQHIGQSWLPPDGLHRKSHHGAQSWPPPDALHRKGQNIGQSWPPPDALHVKGQHVGQSWPPPDVLDGKSHHVGQSWPPPDALQRKGQHGAQSWPPPDVLDGNSQHGAQSWPPPDVLDGNRQRGAQSWPPPDVLDGNRQRGAQSWPPPDALHGKNHHGAQPWFPPSIKKKENDHRNTHRPYPATRLQPDYRNSPQWRPQPYQSNPPAFLNQWQPPPPNIHFYPPPPPGVPSPHPPYSQPHGHQCRPPENLRLGPDIRPAPSHSPAPYNPCEALEGRHPEEQNCQDVEREIGNAEPPLVLVLMRGVPGSGKSTLARQISSRGPSGLILSTDDYFYQKDGYHYDPRLLGIAHDWNHERAEKAMLEGRTPVIIDNTNVRAWEMKPYVSAALELGYRVEFAEPDTSWRRDPAELERRNHHGVSRETIGKMLDRFEVPVSVAVVMSSCQPSQKPKRLHHRSTPHTHTT